MDFRRANMNTFSKIIATLALAAAASAQGTLQCDQPGWSINGLDTFCKMVEVPADFSGSINVKSGNGAIVIRGWDEPGVLVRAKIQTAATSVFDAVALADRVSIEVAAGKVQATGPQTTTHLSWSVCWEIFLPHNADLTLATLNGAITISDITGRIQFSVSNGAVAVDRLGGNVDGSVSNGAIAITLGGDHWDGAGLTVKTSTGAIAVHVPHAYSAHFEASTTVGTISTNYPVSVSRGKWGIPGLGGSLAFDAGAGGAPIRVSTTVGAIRIVEE
jgi:DUF4097 and DUF4098 domain-containing protein YvlB